MKRSIAISGLLVLLLSSSALAVEPGEMLADPKLESRAREIGRNLRCLVCQNQSIDDSDAPMARDLRQLVRERLQAGDSNDAVYVDVTRRFGSYVLLEPPFNPATWALWFLPFAVLGVAGGVAWRTLRRRDKTVEAHLTAEEQMRVDEYLDRS
jgi:cytochrome c-type biogenesis protein CcmH